MRLRLSFDKKLFQLALVMHCFNRIYSLAKGNEK